MDWGNGGGGKREERRGRCSEDLWLFLLSPILSSYLDWLWRSEERREKREEIRGRCYEDLSIGPITGIGGIALPE